IPEFVALKALEPLDQSLARSTAVQASDYFPGIWDTNIIGGTLYGVPWYIDTRLLFYRRDLLAQAGFAEPPRTWAEWSRMLAAIKALVGPERYGVLLPLNEFDTLLVLSIQQPEPLLRADGRYGNFRSAGFHRALGFHREIFQRQWAPPVDSTQISNVWNELGRGYFSFYISGPWNIGEFTRRLPPEQQDTWMTAPMPGPDGPGASIAGGASLVIFRRSRHKADAWLLLEFLSSPQIQKRFYQLTGDLPPRRSTWRAPELAGNFYAPVLAALIVSLTDFDLYALADIRNLRFVGLDNYRQLLHSPEFWRAVTNTGYFVAVGVPLSLAASLASALLVNSRLAYLAGFFRTALFAPVVTTLVAVAVVWRYLLHTRYGLINYALAHVGIHPIDWLGDPHWALPAIILLAVWKNFGYNMVIFMAALHSIPVDLYEAARLDGASRWQEFGRITLPML